MLLCRVGTNETKVDNLIIVPDSVQVTLLSTEPSVRVLTGCQGRAPKLAPHGYFLRL